MNYFIRAIKLSMNFEGRDTRTQFWMFALFYFVIFNAAIILDNTIGSTFYSIYGLFSLIVIIGLFFPLISIAIRRLHDTGKSGWWYLICIVPFVGFIILYVLLATPTQPGENKYGKAP